MDKGIQAFDLYYLTAVGRAAGTNSGRSSMLFGGVRAITNRTTGIAVIIGAGPMGATDQASDPWR